MRIHLFEFEDLSWFPDTIRKGMTDYLRYILGPLMNYYKPVTSLIAEGLEATGSTRIIDLASGGGGAIEQVQWNLKEHLDREIPIILTDRYPNTDAYVHLEKMSGGKINFYASPVDAAEVPGNLKGFRVMFSAFHHLKPAAARAVLKNAVDANAGIAIFDGGDKNIFTILGITLFHPVLFVVLTPFFRPFTFSRIFFTYLIPLIPLCTVWDGIVSILRLYKPKDLLQLAREVDAETYEWKAGRVKHETGMHITYLVGYPKK
jgi:hypothetical protein